MKYYPKIVKFSLLFFLLFISYQCKEDEYPIPNVAVNIVVDPVTVSRIGIGTAIYCPVDAGLKGIIIYHESESSFIAYERLCTNYPNDQCAVEFDDNNPLVVKCPCCKSEFSLVFGDVLKAPARWSLKRYRTTLYSGGRLSIIN